MPHVTRTKLGVLTAIAAGVVLGAVLGQPGTGRAASAAVPKNTKPPLISGTAAVGQTLTATVGSWTGAPTSYHFAWSLCDSTGAACLAIGGATAKIYTVTDADVGHTLRVAVTARNASGASTASSAPTTVVPPSGCPAGTGTIPITDLGAPERLDIASAKVASRVTHKSRSIEIQVQVLACNGRAVEGATVYASPVPFNQFKGETGTTAANGTVTLTESRERHFPAARHQGLLAVYLRATAPGQSAGEGVSSTRLVAFPIF